MCARQCASNSASSPGVSPVGPARSTTNADGHLAASLVGSADHRGLGHGRVLLQHLLDLFRVDVEPARDDQVATTSVQREDAVGASGREIPGAKVAVDKGGAGRLLVVPVPAEHGGTLHVQLPDLVGAHGAAVGIEHARRDARQRHTDRAGAAIADVGIAEGHQRLAHAVAFEHRVAEPHAERVEHLRRQRGRPGDEQARGGPDLPGGRLGADQSGVCTSSARRRTAWAQNAGTRRQWSRDRSAAAVACGSRWPASSAGRCRARARGTAGGRAGSDPRS